MTSISIHFLLHIVPLVSIHEDRLIGKKNETILQSDNIYLFYCPVNILPQEGTFSRGCMKQLNRHTLILYSFFLLDI